MVNRPEGPTLTKSYRQRKNKGEVSGYGDIGGKGNGKEGEAGSFKLQTGGTQGQGFFDGLVASFLMTLTSVLTWGSVKKRAIIQRRGEQVEQEGEVCF